MQTIGKAARSSEEQEVSITVSPRLDIRRVRVGWLSKCWLKWIVGGSLISLVVACTPVNQVQGPAPLNGRYNDEQPALSGDGRFLAFVSNNNGDRQIRMYDLKQKRFVNLPRLNAKDTIAESPSLSRTGRYLAYITSAQGRPTVALYDRLTQRSQFLTLSYRSWLRNPSISLDGRYIVFETSRRGQWDIEVFDRGPYVELDIPDGSVSSKP